MALILKAGDLLCVCLPSPVCAFAHTSVLAFLGSHSML